MNFNELTDQLLLEVLALKGPKLLMVSLIMFGYLLKTIPTFPNRWIPRAVILMGGTLSPLFIPLPSHGSIDPGLCCPEPTCWVSVVLTGFLLGGASWFLHAKVLKKYLDDKIGKGQNTGLTEHFKKTADAPPQSGG